MNPVTGIGIGVLVFLLAGLIFLNYRHYWKQESAIAPYTPNPPRPPRQKAYSLVARIVCGYSDPPQN